MHDNKNIDNKNIFYLFIVSIFLSLFLMFYQFKSLYWMFFFAVSLLFFFEYASTYSRITDLDYRIVFTIQIVLSWFMLAVISQNVIFVVIGVLNALIMSYYPDVKFFWVLSNFVAFSAWLALVQRVDVLIFLIGFLILSMIPRGYFLLLLLVCGLILGIYKS